MPIQIPEPLYKEIMAFATFNILWYLRDKFTPTVRKELPEHWKAFQSYVKGTQLPKQKWIKRNEVKLFPFKTDTMGPQYQKLTPVKKEIRVGLDWMGTLIGNRKTTRAAWLPSKAALLIYLDHFDMIHDYTKRGSHPANIVYIFSELREIVRHELEHVTQDFLLAPVAPKQIEKKPDYSKHGKDYYTSQVEFEPTITTAVNDFMNSYVIVSESKPVNIGKAFRQFVGAAPAWKHDPFSEADFFKHLKSNPRRYKIAVRKFYQGVKQRLDTLNRKSSD